jgi:hypothetical protein
MIDLFFILVQQVLLFIHSYRFALFLISAVANYIVDCRAHPEKLPSEDDSGPVELERNHIDSIFPVGIDNFRVHYDIDQHRVIFLELLCAVPATFKLQRER